MLDRPDLRRHLLAAIGALSEADQAARALRAEKAEGLAVDEGDVPRWWMYPFAEIEPNRRRLESITVDGGWDTRFLSVDVVREISVVRRSLVRMGKLDAPVSERVAAAIQRLDSALACFGLTVLSLREATYLQSLYEAAAAMDGGEVA